MHLIKVLICIWMCVCVPLLLSVSLHFHRGECRLSILAHRCCSEPECLRSGGRYPAETGAACLSVKDGGKTCVSSCPTPPTLSRQEGAWCISKTHQVTEEPLKQTEVIPFTDTETMREKKEKKQGGVFSLIGINVSGMIGMKVKLYETFNIVGIFRLCL